MATSKIRISVFVVLPPLQPHNRRIKLNIFSQFLCFKNSAQKPVSHFFHWLPLLTTAWLPIMLIFCPASTLLVSTRQTLPPFFAPPPSTLDGDFAVLKSVNVRGGITCLRVYCAGKGSGANTGLGWHLNGARKWAASVHTHLGRLLTTSQSRQKHTQRGLIPRHIIA